MCWNRKENIVPFQGHVALVNPSQSVLTKSLLPFQSTTLFDSKHLHTSFYFHLALMAPKKEAKDKVTGDKGVSRQIYGFCSALTISAATDKVLTYLRKQNRSCSKDKGTSEKG